MAEIKQFPNLRRSVDDTMRVAHDIAGPLLEELAQTVARRSIKQFGDDQAAPYVLGWMVALARSLVIAGHLAGIPRHSIESLICEVYDDLYGGEL